MVLRPGAANAPKRAPGASFLPQSSPRAAATSAGSRPSTARPSGGHRLGDASSVDPGAGGGSVTTRCPPGRRNPTAHSAVVAGGPNDRAVTRSNAPRSSGSRASSSARPSATRHRSPSPSASIASRRNSQRRCWASSSTTDACGERGRDHEPGEPATGSQIEDPPRGRVQHRGKIGRVLELAADGPRSDEPPTLRLGDERVEVGAGHAGRSTTRRRGSSPSDSVATPSISAAVSCTTLRSDADIGSSRFGRPLSTTSAASDCVNSSSASRRFARYPATSTWIRAP